MSGLGVFDPDLFEQGDPWNGGLPLDLYTELRDRRPCYWQGLEDEPLFVDGTWVVSRHDDCIRIIKDTDRFSNQAGTSVRRFDPTIAERGGRPTMVTMDGAEHQRNRTVTSRLFAPRAVAAWADNFRAIAVRIIERALDMGPIDLVTDLACYMPLDAISEMLGIPPEDREQVLRWTNMMTVPLDPHYTPTPEDFMGALHGLWDYGLALAARRRAEPDDSVMSAIAAANADGRLSDAEVQGYMLQLAAAGNETTRNAITHGLRLLTAHPEQRRIWFDDFDRHAATAVEEIVRCEPLISNMCRVLTQDVELHGITLRAGEKVALWYPSANRDDTVFDDPGRFDVRRPLHPQQVGYGAGGPHFCLGANLARREMTVMFDEIRRRTPDLAVTGEPERVVSMALNSVRRLDASIAP